MNIPKILALSIGIACLLMLLGAQCGQQPNPAVPVKATTVAVSDSIPYDLHAPARTIQLGSADLSEISALSPTPEPGVFLAVADERGEVFFIDSKLDGAISKRITFRENGDFEGVEMVDSVIFCLKSDGVIFEISHWDKGKAQVREFPTVLTKDNNVEGLGYDAGRQALLLACKEDSESDVPRRVYAFDLQTHQLGATPVYTIDPRDVNARVPYSDEDKSQNFFSTSGVAVHPLTQDIYLISTALKRLVVLDHGTGKIRFATRLDKQVIPQPEGIAFDPAGNLYLSSEGKGGAGFILVFPYHGPKGQD